MNGQGEGYRWINNAKTVFTIDNVGTNQRCHCPAERATGDCPVPGLQAQTNADRTAEDIRIFY
ncbi:MAG: hypothetical protein IKE94_16505 [Aeriscardovia sp.]|nr:hypothetical protein [Aeriscardovia sp.]